MELTKDKLNMNQCTGCCLCANGCPVEAISMKEDKNGFLYPHINNKLCIDCGKCTELCDGRNEQYISDVEKRAYAVWSKNSEIRYKSTSGGAFSEFAKYVLLNDGVVAGAAYNECNQVDHILIDNLEQLSLVRQSKYIQSDSKDIYKKVKYALDNGKLVLFCGTPCQLAALKSYLNKDYEKLFLMSFICLGVNSPKALRAWLEEIEQKENNSVQRVWFKYKKHGWHKSPLCTRLDFKDGSHKVYFGDENTFMKGYIRYHLYIRPSCTDCRFKGLTHGADVMVADFWGEQITDDNGTSLLIVNSKKGEKMLNEIKMNFCLEEVDFSQAILGNRAFREPVKASKYSDKFLAELDVLGFSSAYKKYAKDPLKVIIKRKIKNTLRVCLKNIVSK